MNSDTQSTARLNSPREILLEFDNLRARLDEAEQTLEAIRSGDVDALVVYGEHGEKVYTLKGADEPYRVFVEDMKEGAVTLSTDGTILYCNQSFAEMAGTPLEKVIGSSIQNLLFGREGDSFDEIVSRLSDQSTRAEMVVLKPGTELPAQVSFSKIDSDGPAVIALTVTDLSLQREHETQLEKANAELEGFCYSVSHDLRAPLRSIIGAAHVVIEDYASELPEAARADLEHISRSANYLGKLIDDLLAYSRLARYPIHLQSVDLTALAQEISNEVLVREFGDAEWTIEGGMNVEGDPRLVRLALENLMSNAAKYSSKSERPHIEVGSMSWDQDKAFFVRDNGIGFEMTYVEKIFKPFERLHRQDDYPGTGIGLANARRIIARHGGEIWAEAHPLQGATFFFTLPKRHAGSVADHHLPHAGSDRSLEGVVVLAEEKNHAR